MGLNSYFPGGQVYDTYHDLEKQRKSVTEKFREKNLFGMLRLLYTLSDLGIKDCGESKRWILTRL